MIIAETILLMIIVQEIPIAVLMMKEGIAVATRIITTIRTIIIIGVILPLSMIQGEVMTAVDTTQEEIMEVAILGEVTINLQELVLQEEITNLKSKII
jgi:hypothetical protein